MSRCKICGGVEILTNDGVMCRCTLGAITVNFFRSCPRCGLDYHKLVAHDCPALAAATGTAKTPKAVECEASQSGPKGNAHEQY